MFGGLIMCSCTFCHLEIHNLATQAFLKPFWMRVYVFVFNLCWGDLLLLLAIPWWNSGWGGQGLMPSRIEGVVAIVAYEFKNQKSFNYLCFSVVFIDSNLSRTRQGNGIDFPTNFRAIFSQRVICVALINRNLEAVDQSYSQNQICLFTHQKYRS